MVDARIIRTRAALHRAVLDLCAQRAVTSITVSELAELAQINRVTFYKHFSSTSETLRDAVQTQLNPLRDELLNTPPGADQSQVLRAVVHQVLDHIEEHRSLYRISFASPEDGAVPGVLAAHFRITLQNYLVQHDSLSRGGDPRLIASFFAAGLVGAIHSWVIEGSTDREHLISSLMPLTPQWWFPGAAPTLGEG